MPNILRYSIFLCFVIIAGCGFHLRGDAKLPKDLQSLYLQSSDPFGGFSKTLRTLLITNNVNIVDDATAAPYTLNIIKASQGPIQNSLSNSSSDSSQIYLLKYDVTYEVLNSKGQRVAGPDEVHSQRQYTTNPNQVFGNSTAMATALQALQQQAAFQLLMQLSSNKTATELAKSQALLATAK